MNQENLFQKRKNVKKLNKLFEGLSTDFALIFVCYSFNNYIIVQFIQKYIADVVYFMEREIKIEKCTIVHIAQIENVFFVQYVLTNAKK